MEIHLDEGEGKVINLNGKRYGAYKEGKHTVYIVDITCTHLGCELNWNENDKSWDCPCHGSRFNYKGEVLEGPATEALKPYKCGENKINPKIK
ncbi:Rieske 2Fe-2S domain-containing protein [Clostridium sp.]|nr:Rieske 2Fe-2S domain-containing protein [Clostridium sp.]